MKMTRKSVVVAGVAMLAVTTMLAKGHGSSQPVHTVKFSSNVVFTNTGSGVDDTATATGKLSSSINKNTDREAIAISAKGLTPSSPYSLLATVAGTNVTDIFDFNSDKKGNAKLNLKNTGSKKKPAALQAGLEVFNISELDIQNDSDTNSPVIVLTSDTTAPKSYVFMDKLTEEGTNGEVGTITISASNKKTPTLSLTASGLNPSTDYLLALQGGSTGTNSNTFTSDSSGNLRFSTPLTSNVLDLTEVDLTDTNNFIIIAFPLP